MSIGLTNYNYSGSFEVEECKILTHHNETIDVADILVEANFYEDVVDGFLTGNISFTDTNDIVLNNGIVGNEFVYLKLVTPSTEDVSLDFTEEPLVITSVTQTNVGQGRLVALTIASREYIKNSRIKISRSFSGTITDAIRKIVKDKEFLSSNKSLNFEQSEGLERVVIPNLRPMTAIQLLTQKAKTRKDSPYLFFETIKGFNFLSFDSINKQKTKTTYTLGTSDTYDNKPSKSSSLEANIIRQLGQVESDSLISNDILLNTMNGMFSSRMILHDIYNKTYHDLKFSYSDIFGKKTDIETSIGEKGFPVYPIGSSVDDTGKTVEDFNDSYFTLQSTSGYNTPRGSVHNINSYPRTIYPFKESNINKHLLNRNHKMSFLNSVGYVLTAVGNLSMRVGDVIRLNVYKSKTDVDNEEEDLYDERLTGRYFVSRVKHTFTFAAPKKHTLRMTVIKDSVTKSYANALPPNPKRLI